MDTLQIQDAFQPYYADRSLRADRNSEGVDRSRGIERPDRGHETLKRLEQCRAGLARAIEAQAGKH